MHPQLEGERFLACEDFMNALNKCHRQEYYKRVFGLCNIEKDELSKCLHESRLDSARENIRRGKEKQAKLKAKWDKMEEETYGKNGKLKAVLEKEYEDKKKQQN